MSTFLNYAFNISHTVDILKTILIYIYPIHRFKWDLSDTIRQASDNENSVTLVQEFPPEMKTSLTCTFKNACS